MTFKGVIFDLDGTLLNTDLYIVSNYVNLFKKFAPQKMPSLKEMVYFSGPPLVEVFKKYLPEFDVEVLKEEFRAFAKESKTSLMQLYPDELETLKALKESGIKLGIVTNKGQEAFYDCMNHFNLLKYFDECFYLEKCEKVKPDKWALVECSKRFSLTVNDIIYIGDDYLDLLAGNNAKMKTGLMTFGLKQGLEKYHPDYCFNSFNELRKVILDGK